MHAPKPRSAPTPPSPAEAVPNLASMAALNPLSAYLLDCFQRSILFLDTLRERGNQYRAHMAETAPHVLTFEAEQVMDGRTLPRPVNYGLVRIRPPAGVTLDPKNRPVVVVDPRAGHGPGIGGFKADSEIGMAMQAGHPCYFVGFLPVPVPGQTIEDVMAAEAAFLERVMALHPEAEGKPFVIGNCQAGWAMLMLAAARPELFGPLLVAGAPVSTWAGRRGENPMRYTGGLAGGSWLTMLAGDLGAGIFDGAALVGNFENLNPSNTLWSKQYDLYARIDSEGPRYLGFEKWWGGHVLLNAEEMQWIVDNLFVGNRLATAEIVTADGVRLDLRNIRSPIICFCSKGDNITPPQQALGWIPDLYETVEDIRANGQTIVYCVHETIGHLGIFVSGKVAAKEHQEFAANIDFIDCLPPGLYEAVITPTTPDDAAANPGLGAFVVRFEARQPKDILALGGNDLEDERAFAAVRRVSEINAGLYRTFVQPWLRAMVTPQTAELLRSLHPSRTQYEAFSDLNPAMAWVKEAADQVRAQRDPELAAGNPFVALERQASQQIVTALDAWRDLRDQSQEMLFFAIYGSPLVQAILGLRATDDPPRKRPGQEPEEIAFVQERIKELKGRVHAGDERIAVLRALLYVGLARRAADERAFRVLQSLRADHDAAPLETFKQAVRDQFLMLVLDSEAALAAIRGMLPDDPAERERCYAAVRQISAAAGEPTPEIEAALRRVAQAFGVADGSTTAAEDETGAAAKRRPGSRRLTVAK